MTIKFDWRSKDAQNEGIPEKEKRVQLANRCLTHYAHPGEDEREGRKPPKTLPQPTLNMFFIHNQKLN